MAIGSEVGQDLRRSRRTGRGWTATRSPTASSPGTATARSDPPRVLMEGVGARPTRGRLPKNSPTPPGTHPRARARSLTLRQPRCRSKPDWYWFPVRRPIAGCPTRHPPSSRVFGPERFFEAVHDVVQQATFEADCRSIVGIGVDELDAAFWADTEQSARRADPPARKLALASLKLDPGVDPAAWDAFLADYFAAAERPARPIYRASTSGTQPTVFRTGTGRRGAARVASFQRVRPLFVEPTSGTTWPISPTRTVRSRPGGSLRPRQPSPGRSAKTLRGLDVSNLTGGRVRRDRHSARPL